MVKNIWISVAGFLLATAALQAADKPNFVIIFVDDMGYQDVGCFGSPNIKTPRLDQMAKEGIRFTSYYAQTVCGPSRAALMTGCYPLRVATEKNRVEIHPRLHLKEVTIAEMLKEAGYATAAFGKWDLAGHNDWKYTPGLLPKFQGFDYFFGTQIWTSAPMKVNILRNTESIKEKVDLNQITKILTDEAIGFIKRSKDKPFLVYLAHPMPHVTLYASKQFKGKSAAGIYGDVIEEIDWNVGRIVDTLKAEGLDEKTYVIFTSDNGPWYLGRSKFHFKRLGKGVEKHGGSALPLRGAKTSTWEGGLRVPCIIRAPGRVPAGAVCDEIACTMDMMPTLARLAGGKVPDDRVIDGNDITDLMHGVAGAKSQKKAFYYYQQTHLQAVRVGKWKLHLPGPRHWLGYFKVEDAIRIDKEHLYDLEADIGERNNVAAQHPEVVAALMKHVEHARDDIGDFNRKGKNARFFDPQPQRPDIKKPK